MGGGQNIVHARIIGWRVCICKKEKWKIAIFLLAWWICFFYKTFLQMKGDLKWRLVSLLTLPVKEGLESENAMVSRNIFLNDWSPVLLIPPTSCCCVLTGLLSSTVYDIKMCFSRCQKIDGIPYSLPPRHIPWFYPETIYLQKDTVHKKRRVDKWIKCNIVDLAVDF